MSFVGDTLRAQSHACQTTRPWGKDIADTTSHASFCLKRKAHKVNRVTPMPASIAR